MRECEKRIAQFFFIMRSRVVKKFIHISVVAYHVRSHAYNRKKIKYEANIHVSSGRRDMYIHARTVAEREELPCESLEIILCVLCAQVKNIFMSSVTLCSPSLDSYCLRDSKDARNVEKKSRAPTCNNNSCAKWMRNCWRINFCGNLGLYIFFSAIWIQIQPKQSSLHMLPSKESEESHSQAPKKKSCGVIQFPIALDPIVNCSISHWKEALLQLTVI